MLWDKFYRVCQSSNAAYDYIWNYKMYIEENLAFQCHECCFAAQQCIIGKKNTTFVWTTGFPVLIYYFSCRRGKQTSVRLCALLDISCHWNMTLGYCSTDSGIITSVWRDKKNVCLLSTMHSDGISATGKRLEI